MSMPPAPSLLLPPWRCQNAMSCAQRVLGSALSSPEPRFARCPSRRLAWESNEAVAHVRRIAAAPLVVRLDGGEAIVAPRRLLDLVAVHPGRVLAEDGALDQAVGLSKCCEAVFLAHVLGNLEAAQPLDLPLRCAGPQRVGAPDDMVDAHALDQHAHQGSAKTRLDHRGLGEDLAKVGVDVADAVLGRDVGQVAGPFDPARLLELS